MLAVLHVAALAATPVSHHWVFSTNSSWGYCHMSTIESLPDGRLVAAFQASKGTEGADEQSILLTTSEDGGRTWADAAVVVPPQKGCPVWGPVLQHDSASASLFLFFSASVPQNARTPDRHYPGGEIMLTKIDDAMRGNWSEYRTLLAFGDKRWGGGPVSKVTANKPAKVGSVWVLPFWGEPRTPNETGVGASGVLVSHDGGETFEPSPAALSSKEAGWLIENTVVPTINGDLLMLFRTKQGHVWQSRSRDWAKTWSAPNATALLNPDAKVFATTDGPSLVLAYNPSATSRDPLSLARSQDGGETWADYATLDAGGVHSFAYPTSLVYNRSVLTTYSASVHDGIRLAVAGEP